MKGKIFELEPTGEKISEEKFEIKKIDDHGVSRLYIEVMDNENCDVLGLFGIKFSIGDNGHLQMDSHRVINEQMTSKVK